MQLWVLSLKDIRHQETEEVKTLQVTSNMEHLSPFSENPFLDTSKNHVVSW